MADETALVPVHPQGEDNDQLLSISLADALSAAEEQQQPLRVQTSGGAVFVQWDPHAPLTPVGQLVFFAQFLDLCGHFDALCQSCPVSLRSPNAPRTRDVLGTLLMGILCGQWRYAHLSAVRFDAVNPRLLGMEKVVSEDSARRFLAAMSAQDSEQWLRGELHRCYAALLTVPWILASMWTPPSSPSTATRTRPKKAITPPNQGDQVAYHSYFIGTLRVCLDVEVESGERAAAKHGHAALWRIVDALSAQEKPTFIRGDLAYGEEKLMSQCEERGQKYLFKLRQSPKVKDLVRLMEKSAAWVDAGQGFEGIT
jgi:hypothetical protein